MREEDLSVQRGTYKHNLRWRIDPAELDPPQIFVIEATVRGKLVGILKSYE